LYVEGTKHRKEGQSWKLPSVNFRMHPFSGMANTYEISDFRLHATLSLTELLLQRLQWSAVCRAGWSCTQHIMKKEQREIFVEFLVWCRRLCQPCHWENHQWCCCNKGMLCIVAEISKLSSSRSWEARRQILLA